MISFWHLLNLRASTEGLDIDLQIPIFDSHIMCQSSNKIGNNNKNM